MNVQHFEKNFQYTDKELLVVARKIGRLANFCRKLHDASSVIRVEAERRDTKKRNDSLKVMIEVRLPGAVLRAESRRDDVVEAIDRCAAKLEPQLLRYKAKHVDRGSRSRRG